MTTQKEVKSAAVRLFKELLLESKHAPSMIMAYKGTLSFRTALKNAETYAKAGQRKYVFAAAAKLAEEMGL